MTGTQPPGRPPRPVDGEDRGPCATAASVAGLARELESVRRGLADLDILPSRLQDLAAVVARLADDLAQATAPTAPRRPEPSWLEPPALATPADAAEWLEDLVGWVARVYLRYPDGARGLPGCWLWHPHVVEELLWLRRARDDAYTGPRSSTGAGGDWHDRQRPGVARRIQQAAGTCSIENHLPGRLPLPDPDAATGGVPAAEAVEPIAFWWATNPNAEPPAPTTAQLTAAAAAARPNRGRR